jgi:trimeric autotransporter adhesin
MSLSTAADAAAAAAPTQLDRVIAQVRAGLTGLLFAISKQTSEEEGPPRIALTLFGIMYDFVQVLQFPLSSQLGWSNVANLAWLSAVFSFRNPFVVAGVLARALQPAVFGAIFLALLVFIGCAVYAIHGFATGTFRSVRPVQILRATASLVVPLQITIVERLATVFVCGDQIPGFWTSTDLACTSSFLLVLRVSTVLLLASFLAFSVVVTAVFLDRSYASRSPEARVLGRVEVVMVLMRAVVTLISAATSTGVPLSFLLVANMAFGFAWTWAYIRLLPDYAPWRNALFASLGCILIWSAICSIPAFLLSSTDPLRMSLGLIYLVGVPGMALTGMIIVRFRAAAYTAAGSSATAASGILRTPYDVELCARHVLLASGVEAEEAEHGATPGRKRSKRGAAVSAAKSASSPPSDKSKASRGTRAPVSAVAVNADYEDDSDDGEDAKSMGGAEGDSVAETALRKAALVFQRGSLQLFPGSALMDLLHANFIASYPKALDVVDYNGFLREVRRNTVAQPITVLADEEAARESESVAAGAGALSAAASSAALIAISSAKGGGLTAENVRLALLEAGISKQPALDVQFLLVQSKQVLDEELESALASLQHKRAPKRLGVVETLMLERLLGQLGRATLRAQIAEASLWSEASEDTPSASVMLESVAQLNSAVALAEDAAQQLRKLAPNNVEFLQAHGTFLAQVKRDARGAIECFQEASSVETERAISDAANAAAAASEALEDPMDDDDPYSGRDSLRSSRIGPSAGDPSDIGATSPRLTTVSKIRLSSNSTPTARGLRSMLVEGTMRAQEAAKAAAEKAAAEKAAADAAKLKAKKIAAAFKGVGASTGAGAGAGAGAASPFSIKKLLPGGLSSVAAAVAPSPSPSQVASPAFAVVAQRTQISEPMSTAATRSLVRASSFLAEREEEAKPPGASKMRSKNAGILARAAAQVSASVSEPGAAVAESVGAVAADDVDDAMGDTSADAPLTIKARAGSREAFYAPLRLYLRVTSVLLAAVFIAGVIVQQLQSSSLQSSLDQLLSSSDRASLAERISRRVSQAALLQGKLLTPVPAQRLNFSSVISGLKDDVSLLSSTHLALFGQATSGGMGLASEVALYSQPSLTVLTSATVLNPTGGAMLVSLGDAMSLLQRSSSSITQTFGTPNPPNFSLSLADPFFIAKNGPGALRRGLNQATALLALRAQSYADNYMIAAYASFGALAAVVLATLCIFILPELLVALVHAESVSAALVAMPPVDLKSLFGSVLRHFLLLRRTAGGDAAFRALLSQYGPPGAEAKVTAWLSAHARSLLKTSFGRAITNVRKNLLMGVLKAPKSAGAQLTALVKSSAIVAREARAKADAEAEATLGAAARGSCCGCATIFSACSAIRNDKPAPERARTTRIRHRWLRRLAIVGRLSWPFGVIAIYAAAMFGFTLSVVTQAKGVISLAVALAAVRGTMPAPVAAARSAITEGLAPSTWMQAAGSTRDSRPPACNATRLASAFSSIRASVAGLDAVLGFATTGGASWDAASATAWPADAWPVAPSTSDPKFVPPLLPGKVGVAALPDLLFDALCAPLVSATEAAAAAAAAAASTASAAALASGTAISSSAAAYTMDMSSAPGALGLPALVCTGNFSGVTTTTGSFRGMGLGGLVSAMRTEGFRASSLSSTVNASSCTPPSLDPDGAAWNVDAGQWLMLDPGARASLSLVLGSVRSQLQVALTVQALMALFLPMLVALLYFFAIVPLLRDLDADAKMGRAVFLLLPRRLLSRGSPGRDALLAALRDQSAGR